MSAARRGLRAPALLRSLAEPGGGGLAALRLTVRPFADPERLARWRDACVVRLLARAHAHVPFVRALFEHAGLEPGDVRTVADLSALPVTAKRDIQGCRRRTVRRGRRVDRGRLLDARPAARPASG